MEKLRLYYFTSAPIGLKVIREQRLRISRILELNDPFELECVDLRKRDRRKALRAWREEVHQLHGLICFSRDWTNPVQWAHYADKHRGLCLGFDVQGAEQVRYVASRLAWPDVIGTDFMQKLLFTKYSHWSYEDEYRYFADLNEHEDGNYFMNFSDEMKLSTVIVGSRCTLTRSDISDSLRNNALQVEAFQARSAFKAFRICKNENEKLWT